MGTHSSNQLSSEQHTVNNHTVCTMQMTRCSMSAPLKADTKGVQCLLHRSACAAPAVNYVHAIAHTCCCCRYEKVVSSSCAILSTSFCAGCQPASTIWARLLPSISSCTAVKTLFWITDRQPRMNAQWNVLMQMTSCTSAWAWNHRWAEKGLRDTA